MRVELQGFSLASVEKILKSDAYGLEVASICSRYIDPFVPYDTGMLSQNLTIEPFAITYNQEYAVYQYNNHYNHPVDGFHPLATDHWDLMAESVYGEQIAEECTQALRRHL